MEATIEQVRRSLIDFDTIFRDKPEWQKWVYNNSYKYAILDDGKIYPVKQIVSMATGLPKIKFSGGEASNVLISRLGFIIIPLRKFSWFIKSGNLATKVLDKSAFTQGTGIPIEIRPFFLPKEILPGEHHNVVLSLNGIAFPAYIALESSPTHRTRLFWGKDFIAELARRFPEHFRYAAEDRDLEELSRAEMTFERVQSHERYEILLAEGESQGIEWSDEELRETVKAYLWMLEQESAGRNYNKSDVNKKLRNGKLGGRTKASIEYRMQNISSVLEELCMPIIKGYVPARNVGSNTKKKISEILDGLGAYSAEDYKLTDNQDLLDKRVGKILKKGVKGTPKGQDAPQQVTATTTSYVRDPLIKAWVLDNANGRCEGCGNPAPFFKSPGEPFLEVHHVRTLADGGADKIENAVALCPNCHRRCHVSEDKKAYTESLYLRVSRLQSVSADELKTVSALRLN